jgi:hypothetical protein
MLKVVNYTTERVSGEDPSQGKGRSGNQHSQEVLDYDPAGTICTGLSLGPCKQRQTKCSYEEHCINYITKKQ